MLSVISEDLLKLKQAYADALWAWAEVETQLFMIYFAANGCSDDLFEHFQKEYFSVVSFRVRLDMTNKDAQRCWSNHRLIEYWNEVYKDCCKQNGKRGKIAHLVGDIYLPDNNNSKALLTVPYFHPRRPKTLAQAKSEGYDTAKLLKFASDWHALSIKIGKVANLAKPHTY
jgi:hypothetical protein